MHCCRCTHCTRIPVERLTWTSLISQPTCNWVQHTPKAMIQPKKWSPIWLCETTLHHCNFSNALFCNKCSTGVECRSRFHIERSAQCRLGSKATRCSFGCAVLLIGYPLCCILEYTIIGSCMICNHILMLKQAYVKWVKLTVSVREPYFSTICSVKSAYVCVCKSWSSLSTEVVHGHTL